MEPPCYHNQLLVVCYMHDALCLGVQSFRRGNGELPSLHCTAYLTRQQESTGIEGYSHETQPLIGADLLLSISDLFGDLILIYRCWIMWNRNYCIVFLPSLTAIGGFGLYSLAPSVRSLEFLTMTHFLLGCIVALAHVVVVTPPHDAGPPASIVPLGIAGYTLPLATNVMTTGLILLQIWRTASGSAARFANTIKLAAGATAIIVESGLLYLAVQLIFVVLVAIQSDAIDVVSGIASQVYVSS